MQALHQRRVSVVVPTCDRPTLLRAALTSIRALEGSDLSCEILVGDNGSSPETRSVAEQFGATYIAAAHRRGAAVARNAAMRAATGDYLAFLDDDDVWLPEHLRPHLTLLEARPELDAVFGQIISTDAERRPIGGPWPSSMPHETNLIQKAMLDGYYPQIGATVARIGVRQQIGEFDETLIADQDWDWHLRLAHRGGVGFVQVPSVFSTTRPPGSNDALQLERIRYTRRVFFRHALPAWRLWRSPLDFIASYQKVLRVYYAYFLDSAVTRAERGESAAALRSILHALRHFPLRTSRQLAMATPLRQAFLNALRARPRPRKQSTKPTNR
jgi:glycosyltransferase involved in cell wall biosynthesis